MANLFLKRSKESRGKEGGEAYFVYSTHFMAWKFRSETEKILKIDLIYGESVTRIDNWHWRSCSQSWQVGGCYLKMCAISQDVLLGLPSQSIQCIKTSNPPLALFLGVVLLGDAATS